MSEALLEIAGLVTTFPVAGRRVPVVDRVDLAVARGEVLGLVGESGCGKSLTALSITALVPKPGRVEAGSIRFEGRELRGLSIPELRRIRGAGIAMIFQEPATSLNPVQTVGAQVIEAVRLHESGTREAVRRRALELFEAVGIPDPAARLAAYPHQLSGGMKQRAMIAIALAARPRLLVADEPTTALDVTIQAQLLELLRGLVRDLGTAILLITHDLGVVNELADRVAVMYAGRIVEEGARQALLGAPRHPYTLGLLGAMPSRAQPGERLVEIAGAVPAPGTPREGCLFRERCSLAFDPCRTREPERRALGGASFVRCHAVDAPS